jgi:hypothetical protein
MLISPEPDVAIGKLGRVSVAAVLVVLAVPLVTTTV